MEENFYKNENVLKILENKNLNILIFLDQLVDNELDLSKNIFQNLNTIINNFIRKENFNKIYVFSSFVKNKLNIL